MWFIASLVTTLGAAYAYQKSENFSAEIAMICVAIAIVSLFVTLIAAPWQIQLLLLLALLSYRVAQTNWLS
jgi:hypothetical protein